MIVVTITAEAGEVFIDVTTEAGNDASVIEALGIIETGKALLLEQT